MGIGQDCFVGLGLTFSTYCLCKNPRPNGIILIYFWCFGTALEQFCQILNSVSLEKAKNF